MEEFRRHISITPVLLFMGAYTALTAVGHTEWFVRAIGGPVESATNGLITPVFVGYLIKLIFVVAGILVLSKGFSLRGFGLHLRYAVNAAILLAILWGGVQALTVVLDTKTVALSPDLVYGYGHPRFIRTILEMLLGAALVEELFYRGFLMRTFYEFGSSIRSRWHGVSSLTAFVVPQVYFGLNHVFAGLSAGLTVQEMFVFVLHVTLVGVFFAAIYVRTGNLFMSIGVHAFINYPAVLFVSGADASMLALVLSVVLLLAWPVLSRFFGEVFTVERLVLVPKGTA